MNEGTMYGTADDQTTVIADPAATAAGQVVDPESQGQGQGRRGRRGSSSPSSSSPKLAKGAMFGAAAGAALAVLTGMDVGRGLLYGAGAGAGYAAWRGYSG